MAQTQADAVSKALAGRAPRRAIASTNRSAGSSWTTVPRRPVIVSAAQRAFRIASSVASTTPSKSGVMRLLEHLEGHRERVRRGEVTRRKAAVSSGEAEEEVAARVLTDTSDTRDSEPGALRKPLALAGKERRIVPMRTMMSRPGASPGRGEAERGPPECPRRRGRRPHEDARADRSWLAPARRRCSRVTSRDDVPMPPSNSWQIMPVPPPTLPSGTRPGAAAESAARAARGERAYR